MRAKIGLAVEYKLWGFRMETRNQVGPLTASPLPTPEERLKMWQQFKGIWQSRTPDPIEELEKIRKECDRKLPSSR